MDWVNKLKQTIIFPNTELYLVQPIFNEMDINKIKILELTFDGLGLKSFYYMYSSHPKGLWHWEREHKDYYDVSFHLTLDEAKQWCKDSGKGFTIYD